MWSQLIFLQVLLSFTLPTLGHPAPRGGPREGHHRGRSPQAKAVYVMTNDATGNAIIAMSVGMNGTLSGGTMTATGGNGSNLIDANGKPAFPDALSSQDSVVSAGNYLFAVNAGSNTLSMFSVSPTNPTAITMLGTPQDTNGFFPVSVAVSLPMKMACVANQGIPSGVSCATFCQQGLSAFDALRPINFGATQNPPLGPVPGVGDIFFSEDQSSLLVTVKGGGSANFTGFVAKFAAQGGAVATTAAMTTPPGSAALFGTGLVPGSPNIVLASDASHGSVTLNIDNLAAPPIASTNVSGQAASCWSRVSALTGTGFITDVAVNRLVEVNVQSGAILSEVLPPTPNSGMSDFSTVGGFLWALSANNGTEPASITTFDISGGPGTAKAVSSFAIPGASVNTMGMATM